MMCSACKVEMVRSEVESALSRDVMRCPRCSRRRFRLSAIGWPLRGSTILLSLGIGTPRDFDRF